MEKLEPLHTRSDGLSETQSGLVAVVMKAYSGEREGRYFFRYRPNMAGDAAVVEWGVDDAFALFPMAVSVTLIERGYAAPIGEELVQAYNDSLKTSKTSKSRKAAPPAPATPSPSPVSVETVQEAPQATEPTKVPPAEEKPSMGTPSAPWDLGPIQK